MNGKPTRQKRENRRAMSFKGVVSLTKSSPAIGRGVDQILKKYATMGIDPNAVGLHGEAMARLPFGVQRSEEYQDHLNRVILVQDYFAALPSALRDKFGHDPVNMVEFMSDPKNKEECEKLGLFVKETTTENPNPKPPAEGVKLPLEEPKK